jgi:hypothetical protein
LHQVEGERVKVVYQKYVLHNNFQQGQR